MAQNIADLDRVISLLSEVAHISAAQSPQFSAGLNLLANALVTRFSYTGQWNDVKVAAVIRMGMFSGGLSEQVDLKDMLNTVVCRPLPLLHYF